MRSTRLDFAVTDTRAFFRGFIFQTFREDNAGIYPWFFDQNIWDLAAWTRSYEIIQSGWTYTATAVRAISMVCVGNFTGYVLDMAANSARGAWGTVQEVVNDTLTPYTSAV